MFDVAAMCKRLGQPWWGPYHPQTYGMVHHGKPYGVGHLVEKPDFDYGGWNICLLYRGHFRKPTTPDLWDQLEFSYRKACEMSAIVVLYGEKREKHPLGSLLTLIRLEDFPDWVESNSIFAGALRLSLIKQGRDLMKAAEKEQHT